MNKFVFTCGDINGIGPEIVIKSLNRIAVKSKSKFYFICPKNIAEHTFKSIKPSFKFEFIKSLKDETPDKVSILTLPDVKIKIGVPTKTSGLTAYKSIETAYKLIKDKKADAIITAPISKTAVHLAGINFPGHTEMFAEWSNTKKFLMMFLSNKMKAGLLSIHEPIKKTPNFITSKNIKDHLEIIYLSFKKDFRISKPKIAVLGFNPHAGEDGYIGKEEEEIIKPLLNKLDKKIFYGPFSPDAYWGNQIYKKYDFTFGMYHDQVLIPFKLLNFGKGVNYTAGLPFVRTSPDHGTAFDIAGKNKADESSLIEAFRFANIIVNNRKKNAE